MPIFEDRYDQSSKISVCLESMNQCPNNLENALQPAGQIRLKAILMTSITNDPGLDSDYFQQRTGGKTLQRPLLKRYWWFDYRDAERLVFVPLAYWFFVQSQN